MKILLICNKSPWPPLEGGPLGLDFMIRGLITSGHRLKVLAANTDKYPVDIESVPGKYREETGLELIPLKLKFNFIKACSNLPTGIPYTISRFHSPEFERKISEILTKETFDLVQLEYLHMAVYLPLIRRFHKGPVTLREHNIEFLIWERLANNTPNPFKKLIYGYLSRTTRNFEIKTARQVDGIVAISPIDENLLKQFTKKPVISVPFGVSPEKYNLKNENRSICFSLAMIGSMNWQPNIEGVKWFINKILPVLETTNPSIRLFIAGKQTPSRLKEIRKPNLNVVGEVENAQSFMREHSLLVVPLFSGSGIRVKIIEAMAMGIPVISTSIGAEGIHYLPGKNIFIANTAKEFTDTIAELSSNPQKLSEVGEQGKILVMKEHNMPSLMDKLNEYYKFLLNSKAY